MRFYLNKDINYVFELKFPISRREEIVALLKVLMWWGALFLFFALNFSTSVSLYGFSNLRRVFHNLKYPKPLVETTVKRFVERRISSQEPCPSPYTPSETLRVVLLFKVSATLQGRQRGSL